MDPNVAATATAAADVLVRAMSTDAWQQIQAAMVALWRRALPEMADGIEAELAEAHAEVLATRDSGDEATEGDLAAAWRLRIRRLLEADPAVLDELTLVLNDALTALDGDERVRNSPYNVQVTAEGHGRIYQVGGDQYIVQVGREGSVAGNTPPGPPLGDDDDEW